MLQVLYKLEQYLPLLENFIFHVDKVSGNFQIAQWASDLKIRWTSALISSSGLKLRGPKFFQMDNLRFELSMTTFLYGAILRQRALELLPVGRYLCFSFTFPIILFNGHGCIYLIVFFAFHRSGRIYNPFQTSCWSLSLSGSRSSSFFATFISC